MSGRIASRQTRALRKLGITRDLLVIHYRGEDDMRVMATGERITPERLEALKKTGKRITVYEFPPMDEMPL